LGLESENEGRLVAAASGSQKMRKRVHMGTSKTKAQTLSLIAINSISLRRHSDIFIRAPERLKSLICIQPR
jgi:hypothetical protein